MTPRKTLSVAMAVAFAGFSASAAFADNRSTFATALTGYQETPLTLNSPASGEIALKISNDETSIRYELSYRDFDSNVTQAHIHFGRPALTGMVVLFFCTNGTPPAGVPAPQACPLREGTISGTLTAADIIPRDAQGIHDDAVGFAEVVKAFRNGAVYANVHTEKFPSGEIRGALGKIRDGNHDADHHED